MQSIPWHSGVQFQSYLKFCPLHFLLPAMPLFEDKNNSTSWKKAVSFVSTIKENVGFVSCPYSIPFLCWLALFRRNGHKIACKARKKQVPRNIAVVKQCSGQVTRNKLLMSSREELIWPLLLGIWRFFLPFLLLCGHTQCMAPKVFGYAQCNF